MEGTMRTIDQRQTHSRTAPITVGGMSTAARTLGKPQQVAFALVLALEALFFFLSLNDVRTSCALLHSAAACWPGRIGSHQ
jgi:hypothetical protein